MVGVALNFTSFNPIQALFWSAVINGVVAGDGPDDASYRQYKGHGPIYRDWRPAFYGVADDRRHGGCGSRNAHYCSHVARVAP
jgi:hypothetical protein